MKYIILSIFVIFFVQLYYCDPIGDHASDLYLTAIIQDDGDEYFDSCAGDDVGAATCRLDRGRDISSITCWVSHDVLDATSVTINGPARDTQSAPVLFSFDLNYADDIDYDDDIRGWEEQTFFLADNDDDEEENEFLNGLWYIQIDSVGCTITGQLTIDYNVYSVLTPDKELHYLDDPVQSDSRGVGVARFLSSRSLLTLDNFVHHSVPDITSAAIFGGNEYNDGFPFYTFEDDTSPLIETFDFKDYDEEDYYFETRDDEKQLLQVDLHYNLLSTTYPDGEIRDQLHYIDAYPPINMAFELQSEEVVSGSSSSSRAYALFNFDCSFRTIEYFIVHDVDDATDANLRLGKTGEEGDIYIPLNGWNSPIMGFYELTDEEYDNIVFGNVYVQIDSASNPNGDVRAQLANEYPYYSYLSGSQETPFVTSAARGVALITINDTRNTLSYKLIHEVDETAQHFHFGDFGETGPVEVDISAEDIDILNLDQGQINNALGQSWYINIHSTEYPSGEIRGQVRKNTGRVCTTETLTPQSPNTIIDYYDDDDNDYVTDDEGDFNDYGDNDFEYYDDLRSSEYSSSDATLLTVSICMSIIIAIIQF